MQHGEDAENNSTITQTGIGAATRPAWTRAEATSTTSRHRADRRRQHAQVNQYDNHVYGSSLTNTSTITQTGNNNNAIVNQH